MRLWMAIIVAASLIGAQGCVLAEETGKAGVKISALADCRIMSGYTKYRIDFCDYDTDLELDVCGASELQYPVDVFMPGLEVKAAGKFCDGRPWSAALGFRTNAGDPEDPMLDSDWLSVPRYLYSLKFSYTESDAKLDAFLLDVNAGVGIVDLPQFSLDAVAGYRYQDLSYEMFGIAGWQLGMIDDHLEEVPIDTLRGTNVLDYDITYHVPYVGLASRMKPRQEFAIGMNVAFSPLTSIEDRDDHVLRSKLSEARCTGTAFLGSADAAWSFACQRSKGTWLVGLGLDIMKIKADGEQDQTWYGDDPATPDFDDTGNLAADIEDEIRTIFRSATFRIGYQF